MWSSLKADRIWSPPLQAKVHLPFDDPAFTAAAAADMLAEEAAAAADDRPPLRELSPYVSRTDELHGLWEVSPPSLQCNEVQMAQRFRWQAFNAPRLLRSTSCTALTSAVRAKPGE
jgi:hypothetical protein